MRNLNISASIKEFPRGMILHSEALLPWLPFRFADYFNRRLTLSGQVGCLADGEIR